MTDQPESRTTCSGPAAHAAQWDVFIAYPSAERPAATALFDALVAAGARVFVDYACLRPGDIWPAALSAALGQARLIVVLVSRHTPSAYYEGEEIVHAIELARRDPDRHRAVPVYLDDGADPPYGLRIRQALRASEVGGVPGISCALLAVLGLERRAGDSTASTASAIGEIRERPSPSKRSPFRPGRPLYAGELLPGDSRRRLVDTIADDVRSDMNVNLIGERRLGRTSTLNHVWARLATDPATVVARVNMQDNVTEPESFYGTLLASAGRTAIGSELLGADRVAELQREPQLSYNALRAALSDLRDRATVVVLVDEFEQCFELADAFPLPVFYNNLRSLLGGDQRAPLLLAVIATREPLSTYFSRRQVTSTLPSYLPPRPLERLTDADVEQALAQDSPHRLGPSQRDHAAQLADHHPCLVQCAGEAWYRALRNSQDSAWVEREYSRLSQQVCQHVNSPTLTR